MKIINKRARFDYKLYDTYEAGIVLSGAEVKTLKRGSADLSQSYAKIIGDEAFLINVNIPIQGIEGQKPTRTRKLLLKRSEIALIKNKIKIKKLTLVPTKLYTRGLLIKAELALAKAKKKHQKKETLKKRDVEREIERELRGEKDRIRGR